MSAVFIDAPPAGSIRTGRKRSTTPGRWPSFTAPIAPENVSTKPGNSFFSQLTEVLCPVRGAAGHVFDDGPKPMGNATA